MTINQLVSEKEYANALKAPSLDSSEFILLVTGFLGKQDIRDAHLKKKISEIQEAHLSGNYAQAINLIQEICNQKNSPIPPMMIEQIKSKATTLKDDPDKDHNRRFFETRFAENLEADVKKSGAYKSVQKLAAIMEKNGLRGLPQVDTLKESDAILSQICRFNDNIEMGLKAKSPKYQQKDRAEKVGAAPKELVKTNVESRNTGIMKSITPNFYDLIVEQKDKKANRVVDRFKVDDTKQGFSKQNAGVPFVNSISGTTYTLVALLSTYMAESKGDPNLQQDVNNIIKSFMAFYVKNGFHSMGEMVEVLKEPVIQKIFADNLVAVDLSFPDDVMNKTYKISENYTKITCQKKAAMNEAIGPQQGLKHVETRVAVDPELGNVVPNPVKKETAKVVALKTDEDKLKDLLARSEIRTYPHNPTGKYLIFKNDTDTKEAHALITKIFANEVAEKHGASAQASRVARQPHTLEVKPEITTYMEKQSLLQQPQAPKVSETSKTTAPQITPTTALPPDLEALSELAKKRAEQEHRAVPIATTMQAKTAEKAIITNEEKLQKLLAKGQLTEFTDKPGQKYVVFASDDERKQVDTLLKEKFKSQDVSRIAGLKGAIEIKGDAIHFVTTLKNPPQDTAKQETSIKHK